MTRPSFDSSTAVQSFTLVNSYDVVRPAAAVSGKAWMIQIRLSALRTINTPSGFVLVGSLGGQYATFIRVCDGTEGSTVNVSWSGGLIGGFALCSVWNDVDPTNPVLIAGTWAQPSSVEAADALDTARSAAGRRQSAQSR